MAQSTGYLAAVRHPWPCLLFLLPLILIYEGGVLWLGGTEAQTLRNGADAWFRWGLETFGIKQLLAAPAIVVGFLILWSLWRWNTRPERPLRICFGIAFESVLFGFGLLILSRNFDQVLNHLGVQLNLPTEFSPERMKLLLTYIGAGIYEELLFRLILFAGIATALRFAFIPGLLAIPVAAIVSSILFAQAHHIGPHGEPFEMSIYLLRVTAGLYFVLLFWLRGFGVAVGAHAAYDVFIW